MPLLPIIVCVFGTCLNPSQITYMETQHISSDCKVNFSGGGSYYITIEDHDCEEVSEKINKQLIRESR